MYYVSLFQCSIIATTTAAYQMDLDTWYFYKSALLLSFETSPFLNMCEEVVITPKDAFFALKSFLSHFGISWNNMLEKYFIIVIIHMNMRLLCITTYMHPHAVYCSINGSTHNMQCTQSIYGFNHPQKKELKVALWRKKVKEES